LTSLIAEDVLKKYVEGGYKLCLADEFVDLDSENLEWTFNVVALVVQTHGMSLNIRILALLV
jgi:hypothetical protein